ncbi:hypothetical protein B0H14DRAFT_2565135 [Mycena olivaceomarginata]|nr:hypothetical protein B0H14DRAFT_2565135 [Mycena olivaceomarginata]
MPMNELEAIPARGGGGKKQKARRASTEAEHFRPSSIDTSEKYQSAYGNKPALLERRRQTGYESRLNIQPRYRKSERYLNRQQSLSRPPATTYVVGRIFFWDFD